MIVAILTVFFGVWFLNLGKDFFDYQSIMEGNYETPWYSPNWFSQPYVNIRLAQFEATYEMTTNAAGNQMWVVKKVKVGDKEFWTIDYRYDLWARMPTATH